MADEIAGRLFIELLPDVDRKKFQAAIDASTKTVEASIPTELKLKKGAAKKAVTEANAELKATNPKPEIEVGLKVSLAEARSAVRDANRRLKESRAKAPKINVDLGVTLAAARKAVKDANKALKASKAAPPKLNVQLNLTTDEIEAIREVRVLSKEVEAAIKADPIELTVELDEAAQAALLAKIQLLKAKAEAAEVASFNRTKGRIDALIASQNDQRSLIELRHQNNLSVIRERAANNMSRSWSSSLRQMRNDLSQFDATTTRTVRRLGFVFAGFVTGVTAGFAAISAAAIVQFAQIEEAANKAASIFTAQQLGGSDLTGEAFTSQLLATNRQVTEQITAQARQVAVSTKFNTEEIAEGFRFLGGAGVKLEQSLSSIDTVARLAQAGFMELEDTSDLLVQGFIAAGGDIRQFGNEVDGLADKLVFVANESAVTMEEVLKAFSNRAGASFVAVGQSADEALNVIRLFGQTGIKGLKAGEQSAILIREITRSATLKAPDAWKKYGIELKNADGSARSFAMVLDDIARVAAKQTKGFKDPAALVRLFNEELKLTEKSSGGLRQLLPSIAELQRRGSGAFLELERLQQQSSGRLSSQTQAVTDTLSFQFEAFANNVSNIASLFATGAGRSITQFLKDINGEAENGTSLFEKLSDEAEDFGQRFGKFVASALEDLQGVEGQEFFSGIVDGVEATLIGVRDMFRAFRKEVFGEGSNKGFFAVFGAGFRQLGLFAQETLPRIGEALGVVVAYVRDNREQVELFAKAWLGLFVASKALRLVVIPLATVAAKLVSAQKALSKLSGGGGIKGLVAGLRSVTRFAGPIAAIVAAVEGLFGAVRGFREGLEEQLATSAEARDLWDDIGKSLERLGPIISGVSKIISDRAGIVVDTLVTQARFLGRMLGAAFTAIAEVKRGFELLFSGNIIEGIRAIGAALVNQLVAPFQFAISFLIESVADLLDSLGSIPGMEWADDLANDLRSTSKEISEFKVGLEGLDAAQKNVADSADKNSGAIAGVAKSVEKSVKMVEQAVVVYDRFAESMNRTTTASILATSVKAAERSTKAQIDLYDSLIGKSEEAIRRRKLLGITEQEASRKLYEFQAEQLTALSAGPLAQLGIKFNEIANGEIKNITPELNTEALQTIDALVKAFQMKKRDIRALDLPRDQEQRLIKQADAAISKLRSFVAQRPVLIRFTAGGRSFEGFSSQEQLINENMEVYRLALRNPRLINRLTEDQRALLEQARRAAVAQGGPGDANLILNNLLGNLSNAKKVEESGRRVRSVMFRLGQDIAKGLSNGAKGGSPAMTRAATENAQAYIKGLNAIFNFGSPSKEMEKQGRWVVRGLVNGITSGTPSAVIAATASGALIIGGLALGIRAAAILARAAVNSVMNGVRDRLKAGRNSAIKAGEQIMLGFLAGMNTIWITEIKPFVREIATWIKENKGPISYDQTLLRPAGEAIMKGFGRGLTDGFGEIKGWVKSVAPLITDSFPDEIFFKRSANFLIGNAKADLDFNPEETFGDLLPDIITSFGIADPTLGFLHKTLSSADTLDMANRLAATFGTPITSFLRPPGTLTASGYVSDHTQGTAVDFSNGSRPTPQMDALHAAIEPLLGTIFKQILYRTMVGGNHYNHVHAAWLKGAGFSMNSGKKGDPMGFNFPGSSAIVDSALYKAAMDTNVSVHLLGAIAKAESNFNPYAGSPAGARGLMQLMPATAAGLGVRNVYDPFDNAMGGAKYIKQMLSMFGGNLRLALAGYNAGPGAAEVALTSYAETIEYVRRVLENLRLFGGTGNFRAQGGKVNANTPYIVGERGREMFIPSSNGSVISTRDLRDLIDAMRSGQVQQQQPVINDNRQITVQSNSDNASVVKALFDSSMRSQVVGVRR